MIDEETGQVKYKKVKKLIGLRRIWKYEKVNDFSDDDEQE